MLAYQPASQTKIFLNTLKYQLKKPFTTNKIFYTKNTSPLKSLDDTIKLTSWNVCSLGDKSKRRKIHNNLNKSHSNLFVLLDTRTSLETEKEHQKCTPNKMYFNSYKSNARGVTILVKDSCPITDITSTIIYPGNLIKFNFTYEDEKFSLAALYAPNEKDIKFFETLFEAELDTDIDHTLYAGNWNVSLSKQMDTHGYLHENNTQNRDYIRKKINEYDLKDILRDRNPQSITYIFMKKQAKNTTKARLDLILVGPKTTGYIESIRIDGQNGLSDHRSVSCTIAKNKIDNSPRFWRFNNHLLENPDNQKLRDRETPP